MRLVREEFAFIELGVLGLVGVDTVLHFSSELSDESLNGPGCGITEGANCVTFDLIRELFEHIDLGEVSITELHTLKHVNHPASTLTARCALTATLVLVELSKTKDGIDDVGLVVHDNDSSCSETGSTVLEIIEVHDGFRALFLVEHGN